MSHPSPTAEPPPKVWEQATAEEKTSLEQFLADPHRNVMRAGIFLIVAQFVVRFGLAMRGWFVGDDYAFIGRSWQFASPTLEYLSRAYSGHVMPGSLLWVWICTHLAPYNFLLPTLVDAVIQAVTAFVVLRLLIALFDRRWAVLAPFTLFLFTVITLPAFVWWAAALNQSPLQLAIAGVLLNHVQYLRTGDQRRAWAAAACFVLGLGFSEKTMLVSGLIFALTFAYFTPGQFADRLRTVVVRHWRVWILYVLVGVPYIVYYAVYVPSPIIGDTPSTADVTALAGNQIFRTIIPAFVGGPWEWTAPSSNAAIAATSDSLVIVCTVLFALVVGLSVFLHQRAAYAWFVLLGYATVNCALLAFSRAKLVGLDVGLEYRYTTDVAIVAMVCGALAFIPVSPAFPDDLRQPLLPRPGALDRLRELRSSDALSIFPSWGPGTACTALVAVVTLSSLYSSWTYIDLFSPNLGKTLIANAQKGAADLPENSAVSDMPVDDRAVWSLVYPYTRPSRLLPPLGVDLPYVKVGTSVENLLILDAKGRYQPAYVKGLAADPGPEPNCGYRITTKPATITMPARTIPWSWTIRIGYLSTGSATATVTAASTPMKVTIHRGPGTIYLPVSGRVHTIRFSGWDRNVQLCTNDVTVGTPIPVTMATFG